MAILFILTMICAVLLAFTGSLPVWAAGAITAACLIGLLLIGIVKQQHQRQLKKRIRHLNAEWGMATRHLGGLPMPLDTSGNLFLIQNHLMLDTEYDQHYISLAGLQRIILVTVDQIKKLSDRQLCDLLETGSVRSFSSLREKIRHHDSVLHNQALLMIVYREAEEDARLLILAGQYGLIYTKGLMSRSSVCDRIRLISQDGSLETPQI